MDVDELDDYTDDPYDVLGVTKGASEKDIKKSYRKLALEHHPDRQTNDKDRKKASDKFASIAQAYEVLTDPDLRKEYDRLSAEANEDSEEENFNFNNNKYSTSNNSKKKGGSGGSGSKGKGSGKGGRKGAKPPSGFRPHFHDPYEVWKRDFEETHGFPYPGSEYDFVECDEPSVPNSNNNRLTNGQNSNTQKPPPVLSNDTRLVKRDKNVGAIVKAEAGGKNNRPIAMEVKTRQEGPVTITETTFKRPDGSTETVISKTGIPGKKPDNKNRKMIEGPKQNKMIEGPKQRKKMLMLTNGNKSRNKNAKTEQPKSPTKKKNRKLLANEAHSSENEQKTRRGLFGWGKKQ